MAPGKEHHERNAAHSLQESRRLLNDALKQLNLCEDAYLGREDADWEKVARLADKAFVSAQASILPLGNVGTHALRRVALE